jgi:thioredoxin-like negative regulator of GroEL
MEPVLESLVGIYGREINFHKVDIEDFPEITEHYGVRKVPTILIFNEGSLVDFAVGAISRRDLASKLEKVLEAKIKRNS